MLRLPWKTLARSKHTLRYKQVYLSHKQFSKFQFSKLTYRETWFLCVKIIRITVKLYENSFHIATSIFHLFISNIEKSIRIVSIRSQKETKEKKRGTGREKNRPAFTIRIIEIPKNNFIFHIRMAIFAGTQKHTFTREMDSGLFPVLGKNAIPASVSKGVSRALALDRACMHAREC